MNQCDPWGTEEYNLDNRDPLELMRQLRVWVDKTLSSVNEVQRSLETFLCTFKDNVDKELEDLVKS